MSNLYRWPFKDASYQVSVHLTKRFQRKRFFRNQLIRNKNCLWWPCLLTDWDEMSNLHRGPSINASYQVSVHLAKGFQRRRLKCEKLTRRRTTDAKWWQKLTLLLARWANNSPQVDMSLHSDTLSWFRANQSLLLFCVLSGETQMPIL
jgi:hypothetical protein